MSTKWGSHLFGLLVIAMLGLSCYVFFFLPGAEQTQKKDMAPPAQRAEGPSLTGIFPHVTYESVRAYFESLAESSAFEMEVKVSELSGKKYFDDITVQGTHINGNSFTLNACIYKGSTKVAWMEANCLFVSGIQDRKQARRMAESVYQLVLNFVLRGTPVETQVKQWVKANMGRIRKGKPLSKEFGKLKVEIFGNPPTAYYIEVQPTHIERYVAEQMIRDMRSGN